MGLTDPPATDPAPADPAGAAAVQQYLARSAEVFQLLTEGYPDPDDGDLDDRERAVYEEVHRTLGRAAEAEAFPPDSATGMDAPEGR